MACTTIARTGTFSLGWRCERLSKDKISKTGSSDFILYLLLRKWSSVVSSHRPDQATTRCDTTVGSVNETEGNCNA